MDASLEPTDPLIRATIPSRPEVLSCEDCGRPLDMWLQAVLDLRGEKPCWRCMDCASRTLEPAT